MQMAQQIATAPHFTAVVFDEETLNRVKE